jgi:hypothetical protein
MKTVSKVHTLIFSAALLVLAGCGSDTSNIGGAAASSIYVTNQAINNAGNPATESQTPQIFSYSASSSGSASTSTVSGPTNDVFIGLATDTSGNLYTIDNSAGSGSYTINEYAASATSTGAATVMRSFSSTAIDAAPMELDVDASGNIYVMLKGGSVLRFVSNSSGAVLPAATLTNYATAMAIDQSGNLYLASPISLSDNTSAIEVYPAGYPSRVVPGRTILPSTEMNITALAVDGGGNMYAAGENVALNIGVEVFAAAANGVSTPTRTITGASTGLVSPWGVQVDGVGNIYVGDSTTGVAGGNVILDEFAASASGNVAPVQKVTTAAKYATTSALAIH